MSRLPTATNTSPWIINSENTSVLNWGTACPTGEDGSYNQATPQDGDDGCAYFYNGSYYTTYLWSGLHLTQGGHGRKDQLPLVLGLQLCAEV